MAYIPPKALAAADVRNKLAPRADRLIDLYLFNEGVGTVLNNTGVMATLGCSWGAPSATTSGLNNGAWVTAADDRAPFWQWNATPARTLITGRVAQYTLSRYTIVFQWKDVAAIDTYNPAIYFSMGTGDPASVANGLAVIRLQNEDILRVRVNVGGTPYECTFPTYGWNQWHTLVITGGEGGFKCYLDTPTNVQTAATTGVITQGAGITPRISGNYAGAGVYARTAVALWGIWDCQLNARELRRLLVDPAILGRSAPGDTHFMSRGAAAVLNLSSTGVRFSMMTGPGPALAAGLDYRVTYGTDPMALDPAGVPAAVVHGAIASDAVYTAQTIDLSGLTPGTRYYYRVDWYDGTAWRPLPRGIGTFKTLAPAATSGSMIVLADRHTGGSDYGSASLNYDPVRDGIGLEGTATLKGLGSSYVEAVRGVNVSDEDAADAGVDLWVDLGDLFFVDTAASGLDDVGVDACWRAGGTLDAHGELLASNAGLMLRGNHEGQGGDYQLTSGNAKQKQCTIAMKRGWPQAGAENEGAPDLVRNDMDWVPPLDGTYDAAYRTANIIDAGGENASPLGNYGSFEHAGCLFVWIDVYRYTLRLDRAGNEVKRWTLGPEQLAWLTKTLMESQAKWKVVFAHSLVRGEDTGTPNYWRGSGAFINRYGGEEWYIHQLLRKAGVVAYIKAHDHKFAHVNKDGVNYVTVTSTSGPTFHNLSPSYGLAQAEGRDITVWGDGEGTRNGILGHYMGPGYVRLNWSATEFRITLRQTQVHRNADGSVRHEMIRYVGPEITATGANVTLSEVPREVGYAVKKADFDAVQNGAWWTLPPTDQKGTRPGDYAAHYVEENHTSTIALDAAVNGDVVRVQCAPRDLYTALLKPATPPVVPAPTGEHEGQFDWQT